MGYIIKSKRYKMQDHYEYDVQAPRSPLSAALKIQAKLQVVLQQCVVLLPHHRVSLQHQRENGQRGSQAAAVQNHNLKRKNSESEEDQKRKGHLPEPEPRSPAPSRTPKQRKQEVEAECLSPVLHHQLLHARVGQAYHQEQLSKLLTVLKQVHHDAQQLLLETGRQEP